MSLMNLLYAFLELVALGIIFAVIRWAITRLCGVAKVSESVHTVIDVVWVVICAFLAVFIVLGLFGVGPIVGFGSRPLRP